MCTWIFRDISNDQFCARFLHEYYFVQIVLHLFTISHFPSIESTLILVAQTHLNWLHLASAWWIVGSIVFRVDLKIDVNFFKWFFFVYGTFRSLRGTVIQKGHIQRKTKFTCVSWVLWTQCFKQQHQPSNIFPKNCLGVKPKIENNFW